MFLHKPNISFTKCEDRWMAALLQCNKKDATEYNASKNIVGDIFAIITIYQTKELCAV